MVQLPKPTRSRSGFARITSSFDAKYGVTRASRHNSHAGIGSSGIIRGSRESDSQHGSDSLASDLNVASLDLPDTTMSHCGSPDDVRAKVEIMEVCLGDEVDLLGSESNKELRGDRIKESQCDSTKNIEELHDIHRGTSTNDPAELCIHREPIEAIQDPEDKYPEQYLLDTAEVDDILQSPFEKTSGRSLLPEDPGEYVPLKLKIPVHAREKLKRRSLEGIERILDRKAKLPLGLRDAPDKK